MCFKDKGMFCIPKQDDLFSNPIFYPVLLIAFISIILFWSCIICGENPKVFFGEIKDMALKKVKELRNE